MTSTGIVAWSGLEDRAVESLRAVCALFGIQADERYACDAGAKWSLSEIICALVGDRQECVGWEHLGVHVTCVGQGVHLPGGEKVLGQLIAADLARWKARYRPSLSNLCVGVAGWNGGVGVSTLAWDLSRQTGSILVNLSGPGPIQLERNRFLQPENKGVSWSSISIHEQFFLPSLVQELPMSSGVSYLGADATGCAYANDPRVRKVLPVLRSVRSVVCDLGMWGAQCGHISGQIDALILLGKGDVLGASRLCALSAQFPPQCPTYVLLVPPRHPNTARLWGGGISSPQISRIVHTDSLPIFPAGPRPRQGKAGRKARHELWRRIGAQE